MSVDMAIKPGQSAGKLTAESVTKAVVSVLPPGSNRTVRAEFEVRANVRFKIKKGMTEEKIERFLAKLQKAIARALRRAERFIKRVFRKAARANRSIRRMVLLQVSEEGEDALDVGYVVGDLVDGAELDKIAHEAQAVATNGTLADEVNDETGEAVTSEPQGEPEKAVRVVIEVVEEEALSESTSEALLQTAESGGIVTAIQDESPGLELEQKNVTKPAVVAVVGVAPSTTAAPSTSMTTAAGSVNTPLTRASGASAIRLGATFLVSTLLVLAEV